MHNNNFEMISGDGYTLLPCRSICVKVVSEAQTQRRRLLAYEKKVNLIWEDAVRTSQGALFNGEVFACTRGMRTADAITIEGVFIEYKYFFAQVKGFLPELEIAALGVSGIVIASCNDDKEYMICGRRRNTTQYPGYWELVPSGSITAAVCAADGQVDYTAQLRQEFCEETGLAAESIQQITPCALVGDSISSGYDVCCVICVKNTCAQIERAVAQSHEYDACVSITKDQIKAFMHTHALVPTSQGLFTHYDQVFSKEKGV